MANEHVKRCSTPLVTKESLKKCKLKSVGWNMEKDCARWWLHKRFLWLQKMFLVQLPWKNLEGGKVQGLQGLHLSPWAWEPSSENQTSGLPTLGVSVGCKACWGGIGWVPTNWERVGLYAPMCPAESWATRVRNIWLSRAFLRVEDNVTWGSWTFLSVQKESGPNRAWLPTPMKQTEDMQWGCLPTWS